MSELFDASEWADAAPAVTGSVVSPTSPTTTSLDGRIARIAFDRPEVRNAFRPHTVDELYRALDDARHEPGIGVVLLTGNGPSEKDGGWAFCSGGDQRIRGRDGYQYSRSGDDGRRLDAGPRRAPAHPRGAAAHPVHAEGRHRGRARAGRPAAGTRCTSCATSRSRAASTARSSRRTPTSARFDAGYGCAYFARQIGQKFAREVFFLAEEYSAAARLRDGRGQRASCRTPNSSATALDGRADPHQVAHRASAC